MLSPAYGIDAASLLLGIGTSALASWLAYFIAKRRRAFAQEEESMSQKDRLKILNEALTVCSLGHIAFDKPGSRQTFGFGPEALNIVGDDNRRTFDQTINKLMETGVSGTLSKAKFTQLLVPTLQIKKKAAIDFTKGDCDVFWKSIEAIPIVEHRVLREVFGASFSNSTDPLNISCFTIYDWHRHKSLITGPHVTNDSWVWNESKHGLLAECKVQARDEQKALELADILFAKLESTIRFMIGHRTERFEFGILNYAGSRLSQHYLFNDNHITAGNSRKGSIEAIPLDDEYFSKPSQEFARLLGLLASQCNSLERRILRSVEWTAQALIDPNPASAFIKAATSLEVLFSATEKGVITPSIMAQISESCAHILGSTPESCVHIEATVKRLYGIRSAVVHSGKDSVPEEDLATFIHIARSVAIELLANSSYLAIESIEKLHETLRIKKYQAP
jgi:hypothetical protein